MARRRLHRDSGFTLVELLLVVAVIVLLVAMLLPGLMRAKLAAHRGVCQSNLRQIYDASMLYATDQKNRFPPRTHSWSHYHVGNFIPANNADDVVMGFKLLVNTGHLAGPAPLFCPADPWWNPRQHWPDLSFGQNWKPYLSSYAQREIFLTADRFTNRNVEPTWAYTSDWFTTAIPALPYAHHRTGWNVGFFDGAVAHHEKTAANWAAITWSHDFTGQSVTWREFDR